MEIISLLAISASILGLIFLVLLVVWAFSAPVKPRQDSREMSNELNKIKDQINGREEEW